MKKIILPLVISVILYSCNGAIETVLSNNQAYFGKMIDKETRFDSAYVDNNSNFYYSYSLINNSKWDSSNNVEFQKKLVEKILSENLKPKVNLDNSEFKVLFDNSYNINFSYKDFNTGQNIAQIKFVKTNDGYRLEKNTSEWDESVDLFYEKFITPGK